MDSGENVPDLKRDPTGREQEAGCPVAVVSPLYGHEDTCLRTKPVLWTEESDFAELPN